MKLLGTIAEFGPLIALQTAPNCYYPLGGNSGIAEDFRESFGTAGEHDIGKRVYRHRAGHLCMENDEQVAARRKPLRDYAAARELERIKDLSAFNVNGYSERHKLNQHSTLYIFPDGSGLSIRNTSRKADAWHVDWKGNADDVHLGPIYNVPIRVNKTGV